MTAREPGHGPVQRREGAAVLAVPDEVGPVQGRGAGPHDCPGVWSAATPGGEAEILDPWTPLKAAAEPGPVAHRGQRIAASRARPQGVERIAVEAGAHGVAREQPGLIYCLATPHRDRLRRYLVVSRPPDAELQGPRSGEAVAEGELLGVAVPLDERRDRLEEDARRAKPLVRLLARVDIHDLPGPHGQPVGLHPHRDNPVVRQDAPPRRDTQEDPPSLRLR